MVIVDRIMNKLNQPPQSLLLYLFLRLQECSWYSLVIWRIVGLIPLWYKPYIALGINLGISPIFFLGISSNLRSALFRPFAAAIRPIPHRNLLDEETLQGPRARQSSMAVKWKIKGRENLSGFTLEVRARVLIFFALTCSIAASRSLICCQRDSHITKCLSRSEETLNYYDCNVLYFPLHSLQGS